VEIQWGAKFYTGVAWMDREHKELLSRIDGFCKAIERGEGTTEVGRLFKFLDEYVVTHFNHEERAMGRHGYPDMHLHLKEHTFFIDDISKLESALLDDPDDLLERVRGRLTSWLLNHIGSTDKALGAYLMERSGEYSP
jgi:hemerythrin-like metal-binding protein